MVADDGAGNGQPEPDSARVAISRGFEAHKWIKNSLPIGFGDARTVILNEDLDAFLVPAKALIVRQGKTMVSTVEDGKVRFLDLRAGRNFGRDVEVVSSRLSERTSVILNPNAMLREGDPVAAAPLAAAK